MDGGGGRDGHKDVGELGGDVTERQVGHGHLFGPAEPAVPDDGLGRPRRLWGKSNTCHVLRYTL